MKETVADALRFWEPRRVSYNLLLGVVVAGWVVLTWPHFRPLFTPIALGQLAVFALIFNVCYCAAYLAELLFQDPPLQAGWRRWRGLLWVAGTVLAIVFQNYWIADEIYPFVR
ncbi:MAG TPA: hypothetical protein VEG08_12565 [Terriglobales bacterium]|nr:hypothetical protein [Terriglobales bacterium]